MVCSVTVAEGMMKFHTVSQNLKVELEKANSRLLTLEDEHKKTIELLNQENEKKIHDLEKQLSCSVLQQATDKTTIKELVLDLAAHETHSGILNSKLEQVTADVNAQYYNEIQELKDLIMVEQEEKNEIHKKLQIAENELKLIKTKQAEQQRESISIHHIDTLKQKIMKLRKENEHLKKKLLNSELGGA